MSIRPAGMKPATGCGNNAVVRRKASVLTSIFWTFF